jgi:hypothetical protein
MHRPGAFDSMSSEIFKLTMGTTTVQEWWVIVPMQLILHR